MNTPTTISIRREKGKIWSHIRRRWLEETPEETVRQEYVCHLVNEYGFALEQMDEEVSPPGDARGRGDARADILIWRTAKDKTDGKKALVEPKEGDIICDPASGSGGFLIRFFEIVRQQILASADADYNKFKAELENKKGISEARKAELLRDR